MHWISFLPKAKPLAPDLAGPEAQAAAHAAEARDCAIAMAAYLSPGCGITAGGCFVQLLDLIDGTPEATPEAAAIDRVEDVADDAKNPQLIRH